MNQETSIEKLKEDIARDRVVIIAGTGVSIAACGDQKIEGHPVASWVGLLQNGLEYCLRLGLADKEDAELLRNQIKSNKPNFLISAAEEISQRLQSRAPGVYRGWLKDTVGSLVPEHREILDALTALPGVLATLNYDALIERAADRKPVTWLRDDKVQEVLRREITDAVFHIHGWFDEPESVVLGLSSYAKVASHAHTKAVLQLLTVDRTLLFVGCGGTVKDPNFSRLVEWAKDAHKDIPPRHVLLCREEEFETVRAELAIAPWLQPIVYGKDYKELVPFLRSLAPLGPGEATIPKPARAAAEPGFDLEAYYQGASEPAPKADLPTPKIEPPTLVVDALHRGDHATLTDALRAAGPGAKILVRPGLYKESVVVDKPLEIFGDGDLGEVVIEAADKDTILFKANMGRIANLTLRQAGRGEWYCVDIAQGRLDLEGCDITSQGLAGVAIHGGADPRLRRNRIHDCKQGGVFVYEDGQGTLEDNDIFANRLAGVAIMTSGNLTLRRNRICNGARDGVFVWQKGQGTLEDNDIFANSLPGVVVGKGANVIMRRNRIYGGEREGVYVQENGQATLDNNEITANGLAGVEIKTGGNATLRHNRISGNGSVAIRVYDEGRGVVEDNDLRGNAEGAWNVSPDCEAKVKAARNQV